MVGTFSITCHIIITMIISDCGLSRDRGLNLRGVIGPFYILLLLSLSLAPFGAMVITRYHHPLPPKGDMCKSLETATP